MTFLCYSLLVTEAALICAVLLTCSAYLVTGKSFRLLCSFCGHSFGLFRGVISPLFKFQNLKPWNTLSYLICSRFSLMMSINLLLHLLYWVAIGITFNPTWGLSMLLIIALSVVALFVGIYNMCNVDNCKVLILLQRVGICSVGFLVLCFAITGPAFAGKSFCGQ